MAWTTPLSAVDGVVLTAAQWNASVRDNLLETAVAKATASGRLIVPSGANTLAERIPTPAYTSTQEASVATSYGNLATVGPGILSLVIGTRALVVLTTGMWNSAVNAECFYGVTISGATSVSANDNEAMRHTSATANAMVVGTWAYLMTFTAGTHDFLAKYKVSSGTGTWFDRRITVLPF